MKHLTIVGNIGNDATIKQHNGNSFIEFSVAVNERFKKADGTQVENTDWISVTHRNTNLCQYLKKGTKILVMGDMSVNTYKGKDGTYKSGIQIRAMQVEFLGGTKKEETTNTGTASTTIDIPAPAPISDVADDLPF